MNDKVICLVSGHEEGWQYQIGCDVYPTGGFHSVSHFRMHSDKGRYQKHPETYKRKNARWYENNQQYFIDNAESYAAQRKRWRKENLGAARALWTKTNMKRRGLGFDPISLIHDGCVWHHIDKDHVVACPSCIHQHVSHVLGDGKLEGVIG